MYHKLVKSGISLSVVLLYLKNHYLYETSTTSLLLYHKNYGTSDLFLTSVRGFLYLVCHFFILSVAEGLRYRGSLTVLDMFQSC